MPNVPIYNLIKLYTMKAESIKTLHNLRSLVNSWGDLDNDRHEIINSAITKVFFCETPVSKSKKFDYFKLARKENDYPAMQGIYHDSGRIVSTDGQIMAAIKEDYPAEREGKIFNKKGSEIKAQFPNWRSVIPTETDDYTPFTIDFAKARAIIHRYKVWEKENHYVCASGYIKIKDVYFGPLNLEKFLDAMEYIGSNVMLTKGPADVVMCANEQGTVVAATEFNTNPETDFIEEYTN